MPMVYEGPNCFKELVEKEYRLIKGEFNRRNPRVIAGLPLFSPQGVPFETFSGFANPQSMYDFVDESLAKLQKMIKRMEDHIPVNPKVFAETYDRLKSLSTCNLESEGGIVAAAYSPNDDLVFLDIYKLAHYLLASSSGNNVSTLFTHDVPILFKHELVHNDLGLSTPRQDARHAYQKFEMLYEGHHDTPEEKLDPKIKEEGDSALEELKEVHKKEKRLGLRIPEEALACSATKDREGFERYLKSVPPEFLAAAEKAYVQMMASISKSGLRKAISKLERTINEAYSTETVIFQLMQ